MAKKPKLVIKECEISSGEEYSSESEPDDSDDDVDYGDIVENVEHGSNVGDEDYNP